MEIGGIRKNMELIIKHPEWQDAILTWDYETILDCQLTKEDVHTLDTGSVLQIGECQLVLKAVTQ